MGVNKSYFQRGHLQFFDLIFFRHIALLFFHNGNKFHCFGIFPDFYLPETTGVLARPLYPRVNLQKAVQKTELY